MSNANTLDACPKKPTDAKHSHLAKMKEYMRNRRKDASYRKRESVTRALHRQKKRKTRQVTQSRQKVPPCVRLAKMRRTAKKLREDAPYRERENVARAAHHQKKRETIASEADVITSFREACSTGPVYVCSCCTQTWFRDSVLPMQ